jgi:hypothetical protein
MKGLHLVGLCPMGREKYTRGTRQTQEAQKHEARNRFLRFLCSFCASCVLFPSRWVYGEHPCC